MAHDWLKIIAPGLAAFVWLAVCPGQASAYGGKASSEGGSLGVIVEKDLFRPSRQKPKPPKPAPKPKQEAEPPAVVLPPPKSPPPRLTLSGTMLLDSGNEALIGVQNSQSSGRYRIGDEIEGFRITSITSESVVLTRDDEVLRVNMNSGQGGVHAAQSFQGSQQNAAVQNPPPADIPAGLVPRPQATFQRSLPYRQNIGFR